MIPALRVGGDNVDSNPPAVVLIDYGSIMQLANGRLTVVFPERLTPAAYPDGMFGYEFLRVNPRCLGLRTTATELLTAWLALESEKLRLEEIATGLIATEVTYLVRTLHRGRPVLPMVSAFSQLVRAVGLLHEISAYGPTACRRLPSKTAELRREFRAAASRMQDMYLASSADFRAYERRTWQALQRLVAFCGELEVIRSFLQEGFTMELPRTGADIVLDGDGSLRVETKVRIGFDRGRSGRGLSDGPSGPLDVTPHAFMALLAWTAATPNLSRAFGHQQANITVVDVSHTVAVHLLASASAIGLHVSTLPTALELAVRHARGGLGVVVPFVSVTMPSVQHETFATVLNRAHVESLGSAIRELNDQGLGGWEMAEELTRLMAENEPACSSGHAGVSAPRPA